eukprot:Rhum_TRINITY_DN25156_c0_g1::Rhum_TRINITY_DN25156_c0_g1_i1::g.181360::m.181360
MTSTDARFEFVVAKPEHASGITAIYSECFQHEAMSACLGIGPNGWDNMGRLYGEKSANEGHTIIAIDTTDNSVAAFAICEDAITHKPEGFHEGQTDKHTAVFALLDQLNAEHFAATPGDKAEKTGHTMHLWCLGVKRGYRGANLGFRVAEYSMQLAQKNGYQRAVVEATGAYSQRIVRKLGFVKGHEVVYREYTAADGSMPFKEMDEVHQSCTLEFLDLRSISEGCLEALSS